MDRIPLSDEGIELDADIPDDEELPEEPFKPLDFDAERKTDYEPPLFDEFEDNDDWITDDLDDDFIEANDL